MPFEIALTLLIPTAGRTRYLADLFGSLGLKGDESLEILGGHHGCAETLAPWIDSLPLPKDRLRTYSLSAGGGIPANWNAGLERARGRYLFIIGDDDRFAPQGLARMIAAAEAGTGDIVSFERDIIDGEGAPLPSITRDHAAYLRGRKPGVQRVTLANAFPTPPFMSSLYRTEWLRARGFRGEAGGAADLDLFLRAAEEGYALEYREGRPLQYRVHAGSYSEGGKLVRQALEVLAWHAAREPRWSAQSGFCAEEAFLWRGLINARLRAGDFAEARRILQAEGRRLAWHVRLRLEMKCRLHIRELNPRRFRAPLSS